jgi:hypothetical protein
MKFSRIKTRLTSEDGAVLLIVAAGMFAMIFIVAFVVDTGNWKEHKRHLQLQADAATLAGADSITMPLSGCSNATIGTFAHNYGGTDATHIAEHNDQVAAKYDQAGYSPNLHVLINSPDDRGYYGETNAQENLSGTNAPCATTNEFCPGTAGIDVKATETDLPSLFGRLIGRTKINAHSRVCLMAENVTSGSLPVAVPNPLPRSAGAVFIDEANNNQVVATTLLSDLGLSGALDMWSSNAPVSVTIPSRATGLVIVLSGLASVSLSGDLATICAQPLTNCYDNTNVPPTYGVSFIRGWSSSGSGEQPAHPLLRDVQLFQGGCAGGAYFSNSTASCSYDIEAKVDAGSLSTSDMKIRANGVLLSPDAGSSECTALSGSGSCWHGSLPLAPTSGANPITMTWEETSGCINAPCGQQGSTQCRINGNQCKGNFEGGQTVQRTYSANEDTSGPLKVVKLFKCDGDPGCALSDVQSFEIGGQPHSFVVSIGVAGSLVNATIPEDPAATCGVNAAGYHYSCLRVTVQGQSGNTQALNCDPDNGPVAGNPVYNQLWEELAYGCRPPYIRNDGSVNCASISKAQLWGNTNPALPWPCIATDTGASPPDVGKGLNTRIFGDPTPPASACPSQLGALGHNNWSLYPNLPDGDPRILETYLTPFGTFANTSGTSRTVPISGFAAFYVTGWSANGGFDDPCPKTSDPTGDDPTPSKAGLIVGHFMFYTNHNNTGGGTQPCDTNGFGICVTVMTK